jgi:hypothetical protein
MSTQWGIRHYHAFRILTSRLRSELEPIDSEWLWVNVMIVSCPQHYSRQ